LRIALHLCTATALKRLVIGASIGH
jgi:hypothetical protein